ncbi:MAG: DUF2793 domain-containing protein [Pseudomonadota bacterium]
MSDVTARLDLPLIKPSQAQKHVTHNEALQVLDGLVQAALEEVGAETPPFEPTPGTLFALGAAPTGDWADQGGKLAYRSGEGWIFINPEQGWHAFDKAAGDFKIYDTGLWRGLTTSFENLSGLGVGTTSDATNRLAVSSDATLFNHAGSGHQMKVNKVGAGETASLLFQSGFTGHAEMGLAGDTAFSIKVTDDGVTWFDAMRASAATGTMQIGFPVTGDAVQQSAIDDTAGRLLTTGASATVLSGGLEKRVTVGGTADALTLTTGANLPALPVGYMVRFRATATNTGATTIDTDGLGPLPCITVTGAALPAGYIRTDVDTVAIHDGSAWVLDRVVERGSNANGNYARFADGTQVFQDTVTLDRVSTTRLTATVTFPAAFISSQTATVSPQVGALSSSGANSQQLCQIRVVSFTTTSCLLDLRLIDGFTGLQAGDTCTSRLLGLGLWY